MFCMCVYLCVIVGVLVCLHVSQAHSIVRMWLVLCSGLGLVVVACWHSVVVVWVSGGVWLSQFSLCSLVIPLYLCPM